MTRAVTGINAEMEEERRSRTDWSEKALECQAVEIGTSEGKSKSKEQ